MTLTAGSVPATRSGTTHDRITALGGEPEGQTSQSVYETGRLVAPRPGSTATTGAWPGCWTGSARTAGGVAPAGTRWSRR
ncbi:hypothetical protein V2I01_00940 [Micromonospora sp. BRA006-A]|nr:hypothetical protein [Micromonospora sp. BRA006-A]